jgi:hypothetical protein
MPTAMQTNTIKAIKMVFRGILTAAFMCYLISFCCTKDLTTFQKLSNLNGLE